MKILVIDVAAEHSGALTVLGQFIEDFKKDKNNKYLVILSRPNFKDSHNVKFLNFAWIKKSWFHRLFFDLFYIRKIIKSFKPDEILSLQNIGVPFVNHIKQTVYYHNIIPLSEKRFSFSESRKMWVYQNIIGNIFKIGLKFYASKVIVQAEWIKSKLANKWKINRNKIYVQKPKSSFFNLDVSITYKPTKQLFYPAGGAIYKNHITLLTALKEIWDTSGDTAIKLVLTASINSLTPECRNIIKNSKYPIEFIGRIDKKEMVNRYLRSILVFPSYAETCALPLLEAKSLSAKILAADCDYARESIGNYANAYYFNPFDYLSLKKCIIENVK